MTTSRKAHKCHECRSTIQIGEEYRVEQANKQKKFHPECFKVRVIKPKAKRKREIEKRNNTQMKEENKKLRNLILFLVFICFLLLAVDDKYAAVLVLAFAGWVMYIARGVRSGKFKKKV